MALSEHESRSCQGHTGTVNWLKWGWLNDGIVVRILPNDQTAKVEWTELRGDICHLNIPISILSLPSTLSHLIPVLLFFSMFRSKGS